MHDELINDVTGDAKINAYSFRTQFGILSGPFDLKVLIRLNRENTVSVVIFGAVIFVVSRRLSLHNGSYASCGLKKVSLILLAKFILSSAVWVSSGSNKATCPSILHASKPPDRYFFFFRVLSECHSFILNSFAIKF